uniref:CHCH domain-containing protein n=1 Tax=Cuerna arida TaxID=1464854 RepID=A0A1B6EJJ3_9HEMI
MPRRGRSSTASSRRNLPARAPVAAPAPMRPATAMQPQQPSLFGQMASTAAGVAVGSAIGHTAGAAITGAFSGGNSEAPVIQQQPMQQPQSNPCLEELKQLVDCSSTQADISLCQGFSEALRQCRSRYNMMM